MDERLLQAFAIAFACQALALAALVVMIYCG